MNKELFRGFLSKKWNLPYSERIMRVIRSFSLSEKVVFGIFTAIFIVSGLALLWKVNNYFLVEVPDYGGTLTEGVIGSPRFVNPILAFSDTDKDLVALLYSGLLKTTQAGDLENDLADSYTISDDGLVYTFTLKDNAVFHDGKKVTTDDILYTIEKAEDPDLKSPRKSNWAGVKVTKVNDKTIRFTLKQAYAPFIQNFTLGILPKHIWSNATDEEFPFSQFNIKPIGSGPYKIDSIVYTDSGLPQEYTLVSFNKYVLGKPYINKVIIKAYQNEKDIISAYKNKDITSLHSITPAVIETNKIKKEDIVTSPLPRVFGVFFNQSLAPVFLNSEVRQALDMATDKQEIVNTVLSQYGQAISGPLPPNSTNESRSSFSEDNIAKAKSLLEKNGWKINKNGLYEKKDKKSTQTLSFSVSTGDAPELKLAAELLQKQWQKIGALVEVKIFEIGDLNQNIIKPRKYDALLFGEVIGRDMDLYPFWHSSQRNDPGLNIALYTNLKADKILETLRTTSDETKQKKLYTDLTSEIQNDMPAVFMYSPYFIYIIPHTVQNVHVGSLTSVSERFTDIHEWYIETNKVWKIFVKNNN